MRRRTDWNSWTHHHAAVPSLRHSWEIGDATIEVLPMTVYRSLKVFSQVVLGLMLAGIAYAGAISVYYWTGISV